MMSRVCLCPRSACALLVVVLATPASGAPVSFRNDVMAVLSRAGCNQGACHGNQNGKGGFRLSLRGQDPAFDLKALTRDTLGRRVNLHDPDASLVLLKTSGGLAHEGGKRFDRTSPEYRLLRDWIAGGARPDADDAPTLRAIEVVPAEKVLVEPDDAVALKVTAHYRDGTRRDVTGLAVFETSNFVVQVGTDGVARRQQHGEATVLVRYLDRQVAVPLAFVPARPDFAWKDVPENSPIDRHVFAKLKTLRMNPSPLAPDPVFLRRAFLDAVGTLPTSDEARAFLADERADKRDRLIDGLVRRPEFADLWALKWSDLLRNEEKALDKKGVRLFNDWLRRSIEEGKPLNRLAGELLASRGSTYDRPEANFYRALREPYARAEAAAQVFLGVRLQCAKCHNHPFDRWTQDDYHRWAALFARVDYRVLENNRRDRLDTHEFDGEQIVFVPREGELKHPLTAEPLAPKFLGAATPKFAESADRLRAVADWVADPKNPFLARAQANRVWYHLMGRGLVEPNDDFRASNPASHPALLDWLAEDFADHGFDLRHVVGAVMKSRTYQLSAVPNATNEDDEANYSRAQVRPLQAEVLLDAVAQMTGASPKFADVPQGTRAVQLPGVGAARPRGEKPTEGERFLSVFGKPVRSLTCECERSEDTTLARALQLMTGELVNRLIAEPDNRLGRLVKEANLVDVLDELYLSALSRPATAKEKAALLPRLEKAKDRRAALEDVTWGLINSKEFQLRR